MNELVTVYRYEDLQGRGPYTSDIGGSSLNLFMDHNNNLDRYPTWRREGITIQGFDEHRAGCLSIESLNEWFEGYIDELESNGFRVKCYIVPISNVLYGISGKQVVFKPLKLISNELCIS